MVVLGSIVYVAYTVEPDSVSEEIPEKEDPPSVSPTIQSTIERDYEIIECPNNRMGLHEVEEEGIRRNDTLYRYSATGRSQFISRTTDDMQCAIIYYNAELQEHQLPSDIDSNNGCFEYWLYSQASVDPAIRGINSHGMYLWKGGQEMNIFRDRINKVGPGQLLACDLFTAIKLFDRGAEDLDGELERRGVKVTLNNVPAPPVPEWKKVSTDQQYVLLAKSDTSARWENLQPKEREELIADAKNKVMQISEAGYSEKSVLEFLLSEPGISVEDAEETLATLDEVN